MKKLNNIFGITLITVLLIVAVAVWAYVRGVGSAHMTEYRSGGYGYSHMMGQGYGPGYAMWPGMMGQGYGMGPGTMEPGYGYGRQYGQPYGRQYHQPREPLDRDQAKQEVENYLSSLNNPNLKPGKIKEKGSNYQIDIETQNGSLVDKLLVNKYTGWMHSAY